MYNNKRGISFLKIVGLVLVVIISLILLDKIGIFDNGESSIYEPISQPPISTNSLSNSSELSSSSNSSSSLDSSSSISSSNNSINISSGNNEEFESAKSNAIAQLQEEMNEDNWYQYADEWDFHDAKETAANGIWEINNLAQTAGDVYEILGKIMDIIDYYKLAKGTGTNPWILDFQKINGVNREAICSELASSVNARAKEDYFSFFNCRDIYYDGTGVLFNPIQSPEYYNSSAGYNAYPFIEFSLNDKYAYTRAELLFTIRNSYSSTEIRVNWDPYMISIPAGYSPSTAITKGISFDKINKSMKIGLFRLEGYNYESHPYQPIKLYQIHLYKDPEITEYDDYIPWWVQ